MAAAAASSTSTPAVASDTLHDIHLGASFLRRHDDDALVSLRYTQKPVSLGSAASGLLWVHPSSNANATPPGTRNVLASFPIEASTSPALGGSGKQPTGEVRFTGQVQSSKDVDCVLVWDEQLQSFSLERLDSSIRLALDRSPAPHPYPTPDPSQPYRPLASTSTTTKRRKLNANGTSTASSSSSSDEGTKPLSLASRAKNLLAGTNRGGKGSGSGSDTGRLNTPRASAGRSRTVSANAALSSSNKGVNHRGHSKLAEVEDFGSVYLSDNSPGKLSSGLVLPNKNNSSGTTGKDRVVQSSPIKPPSSSSTGLAASPGAAPPSNTMQRSPKLSAAKESSRSVPPPIDLVPPPPGANTTARAAPPARPTAASKRPALPPTPPGPGQRGSKSTLPPAPMKHPVAASKSVPSRIDVSDDSDEENASSDDDDDDDDSNEDRSDDDDDDDDTAIPEGYLATPGQVFAGHLAMRESNSHQGYATLGGGASGALQGVDLRGRSSIVQAIASGAMTRVSSAPPLSKSRDNNTTNVSSSTTRTNTTTTSSATHPARSSNMAKDNFSPGSGSGNDVAMMQGPPRGLGGIGKGKGAPPKARAGKSVVVPPPAPPQRAQKGLPRQARTLAADTPDSESEED